MPIGEPIPLQSARLNDADVRVIYRYRVPKSLEKEADGVKSIGLVRVKVSEEKMANSLSNKFDSALATVLFSLREVNGKPVKYEDGTAEAAFAGMSPKVRSLVTAAYGDIHNPKPDDLSGFLESCEISTA